MSDYGGDDGGDDFEAYEPEEPHYEDEDPFPDGDPDDPENTGNRNGIDGGDNEAADADSRVPNGVVEVGQDHSARQGQKAAVVGLKEKKIPKDERSTTPYMTKYERARVLGTRALQIRFVIVDKPSRTQLWAHHSDNGA
ncbi:MAG: hypothetical protein Q9222_001372 [Ikaeria aurantiellina]